MGLKNVAVPTATVTRDKRPELAEDALHSEVWTQVRGVMEKAPGRRSHGGLALFRRKQLYHDSSAREDSSYVWGSARRGSS